MAKKPHVYYAFHQTSKTEVYRVCKLSPDLDPLEEYSVSVGHFWPPCNCPARKKPCKHVAMTKLWIKEGSKTGVFLDSETQEFVTAEQIS